MLSSYGWVDPVTKSKLRIPIDRAMELYLAESLAPGASRGRTRSNRHAGSAGCRTRNRRDRRGHDTRRDHGAGRDHSTRRNAPGANVSPGLHGLPRHRRQGQDRPPGHALHSRSHRPQVAGLATDAELPHSILEGKESTVNGVRIPLMLPMKDKLALAHTEVKDMVAFMRAFKDGKQIVSATPGGMPAPGVPEQVCRGTNTGVPPTPAPPPQSADKYWN